METKICSKCEEEKNVCEFRTDKQKKDGLYSSCRLCCKKLRDNNVKNYLSNSKKWYDNNRELSNLKSSEWNKNNPEKFKNSQKKWENKNRIKRNLYYVIKRKNNPLSRLSENVRNRIRNFLFLNGFTKKGKTFDIIGCSPEFLKEHFMSLNNVDAYDVYSLTKDKIVMIGI
jgi:hypothetical protein